MLGRIIKVENGTTKIVTEDNNIISLKTDFLPLNKTTGEYVEIVDGKIVLRIN
ncbi:hypothetical protein Q428_04255 [Fervidicella metallireducens AeB]|uniref:Uncharacterized protein n=1 Tax=Fervidicella metallireducens AeB TaxID=1403537 RepID=A0A017RWW5_9CLOT|nr:hypothetical protein [Fervidicella metallireducens]EYE89172.1 hypothetical protein Q428_04255 [Fervidicella metallireducens AeB]